MWDGPNGDFKIVVDIHVHSTTDLTARQSGKIVVQTDFTRMEHIVNVGELMEGLNTITTTLVASRADVKLWWPTGTGEKQHLYNIKVCYRDQSSDLQTEWITKRIGFRIISLLTGNEYATDSNNRDNEGSGSHGMYFRVNGALIWCRGANVIPMDQLDGRLTDEAYINLVHSAVAANMNMLRIWGGGIILPGSFYETCDELGVLIYHDLMFVEEHHHTPQKLPEQEAEIRFIVRELSSHPSVVLWDGCNECSVEANTETEIYATFVMTIVAQEDNTRVIWPSCPSKYGWKTGVRTLSGLPNGNRLSTPSSNETKHRRQLEIHGPYFHGGSKDYPGVNGVFYSETIDSGIPLYIMPKRIGPMYPNQFFSEFGASVFSSFESMSATLDPKHWSIHGGSPPDTCNVVIGNTNTCTGGNVMAERNYPCDNFIRTYFGAINFDAVGARPFQQQLYLCMISQALRMKATIESFRQMNSFGTLAWQLNEIWPTGGWGCLEYGSSLHQKGQVLGGRWKPLMHMMKSFLFRDVIATCGEGGKCFVRNDGIRDVVNATVNVDSWDLSQGTISHLYRETVTLMGGRGDTKWFDIPPLISDNTMFPNKDTLVVTVIDKNEVDLIMDQNVVLLTVPWNLTGLPTDPNVRIISIENDENGNADITVTSDKMALYVVLTTSAQGRLEENAFPLHDGQVKVRYVIFYCMTVFLMHFHCLKCVLTLCLRTLIPETSYICF